MDRHAGLKGYCTGLMLPLSRKSVEPMAARVDALPASAFQTISWRQGTNETLSGRFAAMRVRHAEGNIGKARLHRSSGC